MCAIQRRSAGTLGTVIRLTRGEIITLVSGGLAAIALIAVGGITQGWDELAANLFVEGASILLGVLLVGVLIEHIDRRRRRARWDLVRRHTLRRIQAQLLASTRALLRDEQTVGGPPAVFDHLERMSLKEENLASELEVMLGRAKGLTLDDAQQIDSPFSAALNGVAYHLRPIVDACTPRVLALDDDTDLVAALIDLEDRTEFIRRWPDALADMQQQWSEQRVVGRMTLGREQAKIYLVDYLEPAWHLAAHIDRIMPAADWLAAWQARVADAFPESGP